MPTNDETPAAGNSGGLMKANVSSYRVQAWKSARTVADELVARFDLIPGSIMPDPRDPARALVVGKDSVKFSVYGLTIGDTRTSLDRLVSEANTGFPDDDRPEVCVSQDRMRVHDQTTAILRKQYGGTSLFNFGGALCLADPDEATMATVGTADVRDLVHQSAQIVTEDKKGNLSPAAFPESEAKVLMRRAREYPKLLQVVRTPFILKDGTVVTDPGYHAESGVLLASANFTDLDVRDTQEGARLARNFLMDEWLGDMAYATEADRANALALVLTPFIRGWVPLVPMALIDGLTMGTGKGLSMDVMRILWEGHAGIPLPWHSDDNEEQRKALTSAMASGSPILAFDEAHKIRGLAITRLLTSVTYADRWLGKSLEVRYPNNVTTLAAGNQPRVEGDMMRRVYWIRLRPTHASPKDRPSSDFRHPDLRAWTKENRNRLLSAALTIISAWCKAGKPSERPSQTMGSFEAWCETLASILAFCEQDGFLENTKEQRLDASPDDQAWTAHMAFLRREFGEAPFTCSQVHKALQAHERAHIDISEIAPPTLYDTTRPQYTVSLGHAYRPRRGVVVSGLKLVAADYDGHAKTNRYRIEAAS